MRTVEQRISQAGFARLQETLLKAESDGYGPDASVAIALTNVGLSAKPGVEIVFVVDSTSCTSSSSPVVSQANDLGWSRSKLAAERVRET